jgi:hypothetical protein
LAVDKQNTIAWQFAEPHFRAREIGEDSNWLANLCRNGTNPVVPLERELKRLMREIDASDIHARLDKTLKDTRIVRGWAD